MNRVVLATRRSALARAQTDLVASALRSHGYEVRILALTTTGDRLSAAGQDPDDKGVFVKELERALLDGEADLAVHSAKDLPVELPDGLSVLAVPPREDPRDVLVGAPSLDALRNGARVGTGSPRRAVQLRAARPDIEIVSVRGNVDTRLRKLDEEEADALVLAAAGLRRLGIERADATPLSSELCVPAPGQGVLAIEGCAGGAAAEAAAMLDDASTHACLRAERALLAALGGGCREPIGALCEARGGALRMVAFRSDPTGEARRRGTGVGSMDEPEWVARRLADELLAAEA